MNNLYISIYLLPRVCTWACQTQTSAYLRSLERRQNIGLCVLVCSCSERSCGDSCEVWTWYPEGAADQSLFSLTLNSDLKGGAVTLVLGCHLAPVSASIPGDHFDDLHFVCVDLGRDVVFLRWGGSDWQGRNNVSQTHLCVPVIRFFKLHVLPSLAAKVHPLPLQPLHGGFSGQGGWVHLGYEADIGSCHPQTNIQLL